MAEEDTEQVLPLAIELLCQLVRVPEYETDRDLELLLAATGTPKSLTRPFAPKLGGPALVPLAPCHFSVIAVPVRIEQFSDLLAHGALECQRAEEALWAVVLGVVFLQRISEESTTRAAAAAAGDLPDRARVVVEWLRSFAGWP